MRTRACARAQLAVAVKVVQSAARDDCARGTFSNTREEQQMREELRRERKNLARCRHENIVRLIGWTELGEGGPLGHGGRAIVLEHCSGGTLESCLASGRCSAIHADEQDMLLVAEGVASSSPH